MRNKFGLKCKKFPQNKTKNNIAMCKGLKASHFFLKCFSYGIAKIEK